MSGPEIMTESQPGVAPATVAAKGAETPLASSIGSNTQESATLPTAMPGEIQSFSGPDLTEQDLRRISEEISKLSPQQRWAYLRTLPENQQLEALKAFKMEISGGSDATKPPDDAAILSALANILRNPRLLEQLAGGGISVPSPERAPVTPSQFQKIIEQIKQLEEIENRIPQQETELLSVRNQRNEMLKLANEKGLFNNVRDSLMGIYYGSRVKVSRKERIGAEEYENRGALDRMSILQSVLRDPKMIDRDRTGRVAQVVQASKIYLGEEINAFWDDPKIRNIADPETYRGIVDYFNQEGMDMVAAVVRNRKIGYGASAYKDSGLFNLWTTVVKDNIGHSLKNEDQTEMTAKNFDEIREAVEEARRQEPWVPNRADYDTWIQFVADDAEELEEMIPYIAAKVKRKLGTGEPQSVYNTLNQEKEKMDKAMAAFPTESEKQFRRLKSTLTANLNLMGAQFFSDLARKDWQPFFHFEDFLATSFQDTDFQDHFVDSALLDREGLTVFASELYFLEDGIFWRYGQKSADVATRADDTGSLLRWQQDRRKRIENILMGQKLKEMRVLLDLGNQGTMHPAFQRLKKKLDALDQQDPQRNSPGFEKRWDEYCRKALDWEKSGTFSDPRDHSQRVIFQHPLARVLRPKGFIDAEGVETKVDELGLIFTPDDKLDNWQKAYKRRRVRAIMEKVERISRAFLQDSSSALAQHVFPTQNLLVEAQKYVDVHSGEAVAHKTLLRGILQTALKRDESKSSDRQRFKLYRILTKKLGVDLDSPLFGAWYLGAHDTFRPTLLRYIYQDPKLTQILARNSERRGKKVKLIDGRDDPTTADEKTTIARWAEDERRFIIAAEYVLKRKFPNYFNFPGHDTPGAGVKDIRNPLAPAYGTSTDSVEINGLINELWVGEGEYGKHYGITRSLVRQLVGLCKGPDEIVFQETGGLLESPRDTESWVKRLNGIVNEYELWTKGKEGSHGLLNDGPISGAFRFRARNRTAQNYDMSVTTEALDLATSDPDRAYEKLLEPAYAENIETAFKIAAPLISVMHQRLSEVESVYGRNPGSAMFFNTLLWYGISRWMDENPEEFRVKFGFAYDVDLPLARIFIHTALYESRLILNDKQWDEIMVGYNRIERKGQVTNVIRYNVKGNKTIAHEDIKLGKEVIVKAGEEVEGEVHEGIIDSFPADLRQEIIDNRWLPMGINSYKPETLKVLAEHYGKEASDRTKNIYKNVKESLNRQISPRKKVSRT